MASDIVTSADSFNAWDEDSLRGKIYEIRGVQVMLDTDLAEIYGYTVSAFNQQVKRHSRRFEGADFMFRLTKEEMGWLSVSQNVISIQTAGVKGGRSKPANAFTEQGIYMLMAVLKGDLAIEQSRMLIRLFKRMKDFIAEDRGGIPAAEFWKLKAQVSEGIPRLEAVERTMLTRADLPEFMQLFDRGVQTEEVLILDGEPLKADIAYQEIYGRAKTSIVMVDDYLGAKTLRHLGHAPEGVAITIVSDNRATPRLSTGEVQDFETEFPGRTLTIVSSHGRCHDRYIALDLGMPEARIYHCGASSKDAGKRITTISRLSDVATYSQVIAEMAGLREA